MAAITKSAVKPRTRGEIPSFCVIAIILCVGTIQGFLTLNQDYLADTPESLADSPLFSINVEKKSLPPQSQSQEKKNLPENPFPKTNEDYFRNPSVHLDKKIYMFHHTLSTPDGTEGAIILDMLMAHAHVYHQGGIYSGSCGDGNDVGREPENKLIRAIGLKHFLQFACPRDIETTDRKKVLPSKSYIADGTRVFTPEYVDLLKSVIKYPKREESQKKTNTIVVHIKRGRKITPCKKLYRNFEPYLPNRHFQVNVGTIVFTNYFELYLQVHTSFHVSYHFFLISTTTLSFCVFTIHFVSFGTATHRQIFERWVRE